MRHAARLLAALVLPLSAMPAAVAQPVPQAVPQVAPPPTAGLGRLFLTPERRAVLDRQRELNIQESAPKIEDPTVTVNGVVRRSGGPETAWINGVPQSSRDPDAIWSRTNQPARVDIATPDQETRQISVGETLYRASGTIDSPLQGGRVGVHPPTPARSRP